MIILWPNSYVFAHRFSPKSLEPRWTTVSCPDLFAQNNRFAGVKSWIFFLINIEIRVHIDFNYKTYKYKKIFINFPSNGSTYTYLVRLRHLYPTLVWFFFFLRILPLLLIGNCHLRSARWADSVHAITVAVYNDIIRI